MESNGESSGVFYGNRTTENSNPNVCLKALSSPSIRKSAIKSQNSASKNNRFNPTQVASPPAEKSAPKIPTTVASPPTQKSASKNSSTNPTLVASPSPHKKIRQRKFLVAKRNPKRETAETCAAASLACKCNSGGGEHRCMCVAYDGLRASQEDFFKNHTTNVDGGIILEELKMYDGTKIEPDNWFPSIYSEKQGSDELEVFDEMGVSNIKRSRELWPEEAGEKAAGPSSGRVLHLVKAFEKLLSPAKSNDADENHEKTDKDDAKRAFSPPDILLTYERLGLESPSSSSLKSSQGRRSSSDRRSRRKSAGSAGTLSRRHCKRRQVKTTSQEPFKLRTEQRGK